MTTTTKGKQTSKINTWKPKEWQKIVERDGKLFVCHFDRVFGHPEKLSVYNRFIIAKESYVNQLDIIVAYTNFFINNYDFDNELPMAYLKIKYALDKNKIYQEYNMDAYIDFLYEVMFTKTMVQKIVQMVEENYLDDIEVETEEKNLYLKNGKKHLESLEFTNQHIKILLAISFSMKIMSPALFHYIQLNNIKLEKDTEIIYNFYKKLFTIYGYVNTFELCASNGDIIRDQISKEEMDKIIDDNFLVPTTVGDEERYYFTDSDGESKYYTRTFINIYNKLFVYVKAKVLEANSNNAPIFAQREIFGVDTYSVINQFTKKVLISENVVK